MSQNLHQLHTDFLEELELGYGPVVEHRSRKVQLRGNVISSEKKHPAIHCGQLQLRRTAQIDVHYRVIR